MRDKAFSALVAILVTVGCSSVVQPAPSSGCAGEGGCGAGSEEILRNGSYEQLEADGFAAEWHPFVNPGVALSVVDSPVASGAHALQWEFDAAADGVEAFVTQEGIDPAKLVPGDRYELSGMWMADHVNGDISVQYILREDATDVTNDWSGDHPSKAGAWEPFAFQFTIPSDATASNYAFYLEVIKWSGDDLGLWVDAASLHRAP